MEGEKGTKQQADIFWGKNDTCCECTYNKHIFLKNQIKTILNDANVMPSPLMQWSKGSNATLLWSVISWHVTGSESSQNPFWIIAATHTQRRDTELLEHIWKIQKKKHHLERRAQSAEELLFFKPVGSAIRCSWRWGRVLMTPEMAGEIDLKYLIRKSRTVWMGLNNYSYGRKTVIFTLPGIMLSQSHTSAGAMDLW